MEKEQIVEKSVYTTLVGEVETTQATNQYVREVNTGVIINKAILRYRGTKIAIDEATFASAVNNQDGYYFFGYRNNSWYLEDTQIDISSYGITITGTPVEGDLIYVGFYGGHVSEYNGYMERTTLWADREKEVNFVSLSSQEDIRIFILRNNSPFIEIGEGKKFEADIKYGRPMEINVWNFSGKDIEVQLILGV